MAIVFECEGCGKGYEVSDGLAGKKGRCKACGHTFRIPQPGAAAVDLYDLEDAEPEPAPAAPHPSALPSRGRSSGPSTLGSRLPLSPAKPGKRVDAENQSQFRAVGIRLMIAGVLVFVLPLVGLQLKGLHRMGEGAQMAGGVVLLALGGACFGVSYTARPMRSMGLAIGGILGVIVLFVVIVGPMASRERRNAAALAAGPAVDAPAPPPRFVPPPPRFVPPAPAPIPLPPPIPDLSGPADGPGGPGIPPAVVPPGLDRIRQAPQGPARPSPRMPPPDASEPLKVTIRNVKIGPDKRFPNVPNRMGVEFDYTIDEGTPPARPLTLVLDSATTRQGRVPLVHLQPGSGHFAGHVLIPRADKGPFDCYLGVEMFGRGGVPFDAVSNVAKGEWGP
jgi:hypothetical protein